MKRALRISLIVALLAVVAAALVPFKHTIEATFQLDNPPLWVPASAFLALVALPAALVAFVGLYRFKRWARPLGVFVGALFVLGLTVLAANSPILQALAPVTIALLLLALIAWFFSLAVSYRKELSGEFR